MPEERLEPQQIQVTFLLPSLLTLLDPLQTEVYDGAFPCGHGFTLILNALRPSLLGTIEANALWPYPCKALKTCGSLTCKALSCTTFSSFPTTILGHNSGKSYSSLVITRKCKWSVIVGAESQTQLF